MIFVIKKKLKKKPGVRRSLMYKWNKTRIFIKNIKNLPPPGTEEFKQLIAWEEEKIKVWYCQWCLFFWLVILAFKSLENQDR
jgi:hypothetical protein